jgi:diguanylate cyclase (GGDEF)-like protein
MPRLAALRRFLHGKLQNRVETLAARALGVRRAPFGPNWWVPQLAIAQIGCSTVGVVATLLVALALTTVVSAQHVATLFGFPVLFSALMFGLWPAVYASVLSFLGYNFFFVEPLHSLGITTLHDLNALIIFLADALGTAALASVFVSRGVIAPLNRLAKHMGIVRESGLVAAVPDDPSPLSRPEVRDLARSYNMMVTELAEARRRLMEQSEAEINKHASRLEAALTNMSQGLCMFGKDHKLIVANRKYAEMYGIEPERLPTGSTLRHVFEERLRAGSYYGDAASYVDRALAADYETRPSDAVVELKNGRAIHVVIQPRANGGWVATHEDVTERRQAEAKIAHMARHDALTSLPNRVLFREKMEEALARVPHGESVAVLCLDLDHFKTVNDTLGHPIGDALLRVVTKRLLQCVREHDTISRLGGDEFAIIQIVNSAETETSALALRLMTAISAPYQLDGHQAVIGVSIGIAVAPVDGVEPDELLKHADLALYRAKADGRGTFKFFEPEMDARMQARRKLELDLRRALTAGEFELHYQPLVHVERNEITGLEALLRWRHPENGLMSPAEFIPVMEEIGLIVPAGEWILMQACRQAACWPGNVKIAVNLSAIQFKSPNLVRAVAHALLTSGLAAERLELEITESVLLQDNATTLATLHKLKELGVGISMDDFGTGYSSLSYLRSFPFDKIKIDQSFIREVSKRDDCMAIVRAVTSLGESLGVTTTAEGVETKDQLERLRAEGCTEVQGYYFSAPRPAEDVPRLLSMGQNSVVAA